MGTLHFVGGEKGGVGKSFTARLLAQYFIDHQQPLAGFDTDLSHKTFSRFYGEFSSDVEINDFDSLDEIIAFAEENPDHNLVIDLAAQTFKPLTKWAEESDITEIFSELGYDLYMWHVMDDGADSVFLLDRLIETFADPEINLVVVQNSGRGKDFQHFQQSDIYQKAVACNAEFVELAELQSGLVRKIDFSSASFWGASNNSTMSIAERQRVKVWLKKHYKKIDNALTRDNIESQPQELEYEADNVTQFMV